MTTTAHPVEQAWLLRLGELRFRVFSGTPVVEVSPARWGLDAAAVRQTAAGRGYRETPSGQAGCLRFERTPIRHFDRGPGTDADRRRLAKLLGGEEQFWASLRRLRLSRADVGAVAAAAGMAVVAEVADPTDRLLLLRRAGLPDEELRPRTRPRITRRHVRSVLGALFAACVLGAVVWVKLAPSFWPLLPIAVAAAAVGAGELAIRVVAGRSPRLPWLDAPFDGSPQVPVPFPASLSTELLGEVASLYGYFYAGPFVARGDTESFLFAKCRPGLVFGTPDAPPAPPVFESPAEPSGREQWLRNHLDGCDELWVSVRHAKLTPARIAGIAGTEGLLPVAEFADATDRILLLRRPSAPPPVPGRKFRMSFTGFIAPAVWVVLCFGGSCVTAAITGEERVLALGFGLTALGVPPLMWVLRIFPRSARVGWLAKEFTGKNSVAFFSGQFDVSPELVRQIAAFHGYHFRGQTSTRAQGTLVTYARHR